MSLTPEQSHFLQNLRQHLIDLSRRLEQDVNEDYELVWLQQTSNQALYTTCFRGVYGLIIVPFYDILTLQTCKCVAPFCEWIPIYWGNVPSVQLKQPILSGVQELMADPFQVASSSAPSSTSNTRPRTEDNTSISSGSSGSHRAVPNTAPSVSKLGLNR